eukprot:CAMPEP_0174750362 /NCGR_PEP_ID=MMETSP1094-20130205/97551_1 /TAXON_ID=156173 /ORGANISM="Chrysochromulina brevifilum, Strain UTEX LB 985" /LENGTH=64 /DNA_ID=CAMNT_0015955701 /DNA_START=472 /DNA_END=666 /DNA_ORIENTATION=-
MAIAGATSVAVAAPQAGGEATVGAEGTSLPSMAIIIHQLRRVMASKPPRARSVATPAGAAPSAA